MRVGEAPLAAVGLNQGPQLLDVDLIAFTRKITGLVVAPELTLRERSDLLEKLIEGIATFAGCDPGVLSEKSAES